MYSHFVITFFSVILRGGEGVNHDIVLPFGKYATTLERFSFECRKTKTKTKAMIGFGLAADWLSRWRKFF